MLELSVFLEKEADLVNYLILENNKKIFFNTYLDRPFYGTSSIITEGVSLLRDDDAKIEFIMSFSPYSLEMEQELRALIATYLDFYFCKVDYKITYGDFFIVDNFKLINNFDYVGFYTLHPAYFPEDMPEKYVWLLPIFKSEYQFLQVNGSDRFLDIIEKKDLDLTQLNREKIV